ncbi:hypothetical protein [Solimonas marina]|uniref:Uncharacterized protein n=1 Tax=Solimonas marina TaxID=2714601 RepID=A0A969WCP2_9GAMM|nr:hypothetical protein [Solimonas marina]NKF22410.1 hypothetical protein [Solimonas marina]
MEMLPIVSLVLWSTGLCTLALIGLVVKDSVLERHAQIEAQSQSAMKVVAQPVEQTAPAVAVKAVETRSKRPSLLKAA